MKKDVNFLTEVFKCFLIYNNILHKNTIKNYKKSSLFGMLIYSYTLLKLYNFINIMKQISFYLDITILFIISINITYVKIKKSNIWVYFVLVFNNIE